MRPIFLGFALAVSGCATPSQELLPIPASIRNASYVDEVEVVVGRSAAARIAHLDERASARRTGAGEADAQALAALPFTEMMPLAVKEVTRTWGLSSGRPLKLVIEIDEIEMANAAATVLGGSRDRLAGSVFLRDPATGEALGQLYVDVVNSHSGPVGLLIRGGGIREELAREFAIHIARALTGRRDRPR